MEQKRSFGSRHLSWNDMILAKNLVSVGRPWWIWRAGAGGDGGDEGQGRRQEAYLPRFPSPLVLGAGGGAEERGRRGHRRPAGDGDGGRD